VEVDPTTTSAKCNRIIHQPGSSAVGLNLKDTDNLSPSTPKDSYRTRQSKKNSSRCSIFGINGKINPLSDSDDFGEEVIYSQESPKMEESFKDFNRDLNRFVEYRSPFTRKETLVFPDTRHRECCRTREYPTLNRAVV
jgi:hypothetical protein